VDGLTAELQAWLEQGAHARVDEVDLFYQLAGELRLVGKTAAARGTGNGDVLIGDP
jgi:hypothetical protein